MLVQVGLLDSREFFWNYLGLAGGIVAYGIVLTASLSLLLLATATWLRKTVPMIMPVNAIIGTSTYIWQLGSHALAQLTGVLSALSCMPLADLATVVSVTHSPHTPSTQSCVPSAHRMTPSCSAS